MSVEQMNLPYVPCIETYGVEIECISKGTRERIANEISHYGFAAQSRENAAPDHPYDQWYVKRDMTISFKKPYQPAELVSPILEADKVEENIEVACEVLEHCEATANTSCGLHIHVGDKHLGLEHQKRIAWQYVRNEETIDTLIIPNRRGSHNKTCKGWWEDWDDTGREPYRDTEQYQEEIATAPSKAVLRRIVNANGKYYKVNLSPHEKDTLEFRQHHGTVDAESILMWKSFVTAFCMYAITEPVSGTLFHDKLPQLLEKMESHTTAPITGYYTQRAKEMQDE